MKKRITFMLTIIAAGASIVLLLHTTNFSIGLCVLCFLYVAAMWIRDYVLKVDLRQTNGSLFLSLQLLLAFVISILSEDFFAQIFILILIGEFSFYQSRGRSILFTIVSYAGCVLGLWIYRRFPPFEDIYYVFPRVIEYFAIFAVSHLAKIAFQQKSQLATDNEQLRMASIQLERRAVFQERTRISREIHDSVGHALTSALAGLQTASHALDKNQYPIAQEMIDRSKESILRGLDDVRTSVHLLRESMPGHPFIPELKGLLEETIKQTQVDISYEIDMTMPELSPMIEITIYRALQEGLTNGIRHGASTRFHFTLTYHKDYIRFCLSDNGKVPLHIVPGFGMKAMKERVTDVGGTLVLSQASYSSEGVSAPKSDETNGLTLEITIPFPTKETGRSEQLA